MDAKEDTQVKRQPMQKFKRREVKNTVIYSKSLVNRTISLSITSIGKNLHEIIEKYISFHYEGKCQVEGFIKKGSCKVITYSSGNVNGINIEFNVVFECYICCPVEGMLIQCIAKNITKAGIRAESSDEDPSPVLVFITRDHHYMSKYFSTIKENDIFTARVIGQRFELNDKYVSIIAELVNPIKIDAAPPSVRPKLIIKQDEPEPV
jgi:DNA-directed RNA polymerase subunit E'/Rpb7